MRTVRLKRPPMFVCGKCLKRHPKGKAIRRELKSVAKERNVKLVRTSCFGVCPKRAVVVMDTVQKTDGDVILIDSPKAAKESLSAPDAIDGAEAPNCR